MVPIAQIKAGLETYIQQEIITKTAGLPRWGVGAMMGIVFKKSENFIALLRNNRFIQAMGLIDEQGNVDIDLIYNEVKKQAVKEDATIDLKIMDVPLGTIKITSADVDALYQAIRAAGV